MISQSGSRRRREPSTAQMLRGSLGRARILIRRSDRMRALCTLALAATLGTVSAFLPSAQVTSSLPVHRTALTGRGATVMYQRRRTSLDDELDSLRLDESKLSEDQKAQLKVFRDTYDLPDVLNFDGKEQAPLANGGTPSAAAEDDDYDPLDDAEDVPITQTPWSGQAGLDVVEPGSSSWSDLPKRLDLVAGDALALLFFAVLGRSFHTHSFALNAEALQTAAPFLASWLVVSPLLGTYTLDATKSVGSGVVSVLKGWALAMPLALAVRGLSKGEVPPTPFIAVSMVATLVFLAGWRSAYIAAQGNQEEETKGNKSGGVFDMFRMITTLIGRW